MAEEAASVGDPVIASDSPPVPRRLWERFSLSVLAMLLLLLQQAAFGILFQTYRRTFEIPLWPLTAYLAFGILGGFAIGMALVLPHRLEIRHPRRALTLGLLPLVITVLNVTFALAPTALPTAIADFTFMQLIGLRDFALLILGMAVASMFSER